MTDMFGDIVDYLNAIKKTHKEYYMLISQEPDKYKSHFKEIGDENTCTKETLREVFEHVIDDMDGIKRNSKRCHESTKEKCNTLKDYAKEAIRKYC